ncbi:MAG: hypothetical protein AAGF50_12755 [Pseudomonadota bacterium]
MRFFSAILALAITVQGADAYADASYPYLHAGCDRDRPYAHMGVDAIDFTRELDVDWAPKPVSCTVDGRDYQVRVHSLYSPGTSKRCGAAVSWGVEVAINARIVFVEEAPSALDCQNAFFAPFEGWVTVADGRMSICKTVGRISNFGYARLQVDCKEHAADAWLALSHQGPYRNMNSGFARVSRLEWKPQNDEVSK